MFKKTALFLQDGFPYQKRIQNFIQNLSTYWYFLDLRVSIEILDPNLGQGSWSWSLVYSIGICDLYCNWFCVLYFGWTRPKEFFQRFTLDIFKVYSDGRRSLMSSSKSISLQCSTDLMISNDNTIYQFANRQIPRPVRVVAPVHWSAQACPAVTSGANGRYYFYY